MVVLQEHDLQQVNEDLRKKASTLHQEHEVIIHP
jgi:hypothetical protein